MPEWKYFHNDVWMEAFEACGLDPDFYSTERAASGRDLPGISWTAVYPEPFWREWRVKAKNETISPNCKQACQGCGAARFGCGICVEPRG